VNLAFLDRDEIAVERAAKPHGMHIQVGHDNGMACVEFSLVDEIGDDFRGQEVGADRDIRLEPRDEALQRAGVEPVEHEPHAVRFPRLVAVAVDEAENGRRLLDELDVELRVEIAEKLVGEAQRIDVPDFTHARLLAKNLLKRLGRLGVAGACADRQDQDLATRMFVLHGATIVGPWRN